MGHWSGWSSDDDEPEEDPIPGYIRDEDGNLIPEGWKEYLEEEERDWVKHGHTVEELNALKRHFRDENWTEDDFGRPVPIKEMAPELEKKFDAGHFSEAMGYTPKSQEYIRDEDGNLVPFVENPEESEKRFEPIDFDDDFTDINTGEPMNPLDECWGVLKDFRFLTDRLAPKDLKTEMRHMRTQGSFGLGAKAGYDSRSLDLSDEARGLKAHTKYERGGGRFRRGASRSGVEPGTTKRKRSKVYQPAFVNLGGYRPWLNNHMESGVPYIPGATHGERMRNEEDIINRIVSSLLHEKTHQAIAPRHQPFQDIPLITEAGEISPLLEQQHEIGAFSLQFPGGEKEHEKSRQAYWGHGGVHGNAPTNYDDPPWFPEPFYSQQE